MYKKFFILMCGFILLAGVCFAQARVANDPSIIGVGARPLGMGKSFAAVVDDPSAIFMNPGGLGIISRWQASSMSTKYLNEFDYVQFSSVIPTKFGNFGIGYSGTGYSFTAPSSEVIIIGNIEKYFPSPTGTISYSWGNSAFLLSYGKAAQFGNLLNIANLYLGATAKIYSQSLSGSATPKISASGFDLDLGLLYQPWKELKTGLYLKNIVPSSMGGGMKWDNGVTESLPALGRLALSYQLLGEKGRFGFSGQELLLTFDFETYLNRAINSTCYGLEWIPIEFLALRLGREGNESTYGIGINYDNFRFDYAYHSYYDISSLATSYFSLSYGVGKIKPPVKKDYLKVLFPKEKTISYADKIVLRGKVLEKEVARLVLSGTNLEITADANSIFETEVELNFGYNLFTIEAYDRQNNLLKTLNWQILRLTTFSDLNEEYWAKLPIEVLATLGIITGYPDGTFRPEGNITRAEMCALLIKSKIQTSNIKIKENLFKDVSAKHWAAGYIAQAATQGVIKGYPDGTFRPGGNITRAEGISIIARYVPLELERVKARLLEPPYYDVPGRHWAVVEITAAKEAKILNYIKGNLLEPNRLLTRAEVAELLFRTPTAKEILKDKNILQFIE